MVHAGNGDDVYAGQQKMIELGLTGLKGHLLSRRAVVSSRFCFDFAEQHLVVM